MLTRAGHAVLHAGLLLILAALAMGNDYYLVAGSVPLLFFLLGAGMEPPSALKVERTASAAKVAVGESVRVEVRVRAGEGRGLLEVHCPLPEVFELVAGSNLHVLRKGRKPLDATFAFTMRCTKRGAWRLPPVHVEAVHALGLRPGARGPAGPALEVEVVPRIPGVRRVRPIQGIARRIFPDGDAARTGVATTEFRDIRAYVWGDAPKTINWKATARRQGAERGASLPLVNEYEREGKKTVWLMVDCGQHMEVGSTGENGFEFALQAAGSLARFYLERGYSLGAYFYNAQDQLLHPETGGRQILKVTRLLTQLAPSPPHQTLREAVERCRPFLVRGRPLVVVVTRAARDPDDVAAAVQRIRAVAGLRRKRVPVLLVSPAVHGLFPQEDFGSDAAVLARRLERPAMARLRNLGATVVEWDPRKQSFAAAMWGVR